MKQKRTGLFVIMVLMNEEHERFYVFNHLIWWLCSGHLHTDDDAIVVIFSFPEINVNFRSYVVSCNYCIHSDGS